MLDADATITSLREIGEMTFANDGTPLREAAEQGVGEDRVLGAWLDFLARDMEENPHRLVPLGEAQMRALQALVEGVEVDLDEPLPDDVTF